MAEKRPVCSYEGQLKELQGSDSLPSVFGKNFIINPEFAVNQITEGIDSLATNGYFGDIWQYKKVGNVVRGYLHGARSKLTIDSYSETTRDDRYNLYAANYTSAGQAIAIAIPTYIGGAKFFLAKNGSPTGNAVAKLYACTGTPGSTGVPTGAALATSGNLDVSTLSATYALTAFTFGIPYLAAPGNYCICIEYAGGDASNTLFVGLDLSSPTHAGNGCDNGAGGGAWRAQSGYDTIFYLLSGQYAMPTPPVGHSQIANCAIMPVTTADDSIAAGDFEAILTKIEGVNFSFLIGRTATLSFWVKGAKTGTHCVFFQNSDASYSYVAEYTISSANTWEYKTVTLTFNSAGTWLEDNNIGCVVGFTLEAGSTFQTTADTWQAGAFYATANQVNEADTSGNIFAITGVQLVPGSAALPYCPDAYSVELAKVAYYVKTFFARNGNTNTNPYSYRVAALNGNTYAHIFTYEKMRVAPTATLVGTWTSTGTSNGAVYIGAALPTKSQIYATANANGEIVIYSSGVNPYALLDSRL